MKVVVTPISGRYVRILRRSGFDKILLKAVGNKDITFCYAYDERDNVLYVDPSINRWEGTVKVYGRQGFFMEGWDLC